MEHQGYNGSSYGVKNNLKTYQKQEFTEDLGLNTHEWKYRVSDPAIGRFWQIDPLAEDYVYNSTYAFQENKLGMGIELEGLEMIQFDMLRRTGDALTGGKVSQVLETVGGFLPGAGTVMDITEAVTGETLSGEKLSLGQRAIVLIPGKFEKIGGVVNAIVKKGDDVKDATKTFQTYTKTNKKTGEVYSGRTSGIGTPAENVAKRDGSHHMNDKGFGKAKLDKSSTNSDAIRGREQQLIDANGGAKSQGGTSGNAINGVGNKNKKKQQYSDAAKKEFE